MSRDGDVYQQPGVASPWLCRALIDGMESHPELHRTGDSRASLNGPGWAAFVAAPVPRDVVPMLDLVTAQGAEVLDLPVQQTRYSIGRYDVGGAQDWHADYDPTHLLGAARTMSWSMLLSHPNDFRGGRLVAELGGREVDLAIGQGTAAYFPATMRHMVTPVTDGRRYVLIAFAGTTLGRPNP